MKGEVDDYHPESFWRLKPVDIPLSGEIQEELHTTYMQLGATDHLLKPVNLDELKTSILAVSRHIDARK